MIGKAKTRIRRVAGGKRLGNRLKPAFSMIICCLLVLAFKPRLDCRADTIVLLEGQMLTGRILVEKDTQLFVDIGVTVLAVPKAEILKYEYTDGFGLDSGDANDVNQPDTTGSVAQTVGDRLYRTADLKATTIVESAKAVSEAVV